MLSDQYNLTLEERQSYLLAQVQADVITLEIVIDYTNRIIERLRNVKDPRLLFINDAPILNPVGMYQIASSIVRNALPNGVKIAVIDVRPEQLNRQRVISDQGRLAGLDIKSFRDHASAEEWLLSAS